MSFLSTAFSNISHAVTSGISNLAASAGQIGTQLGPIVAAFNPSAGAMMQQFGAVGTAISGQGGSSGVHGTAAQAVAVSNVPLTTQGSAYANPPATFAGLSVKTWLLIGGGVVALGLVIYLVKG
jgi:hypothetical protein